MSAAEHKDEGTRHFKAKQYAEAARSYTRAIELESDPVELACWPVAKLSLLALGVGLGPTQPPLDTCEPL